MQKTKKELSNCTVICLDARNRLAQTLLVRAVFFFAAMVIFLGFFVFMAALEVETENADKLVEEFSQMVMDLDGNGPIFAHNAFLALLMFVTWSWCSLGNNICIRYRLRLCIIVAFKSRSTVYISRNIFHHVWRIRADCIFYCNFT